MQTPESFLATHSKIQLDIKNTRTYKANKSVVHYIPIRVNDKPLLINFNNQILASGAKPPVQSDAIKYLNVAFKKTTDFSNYKPTETLQDANTTFINFLDDLESQYLQISKQINQ